MPSSSASTTAFWQLIHHDHDTGGDVPSRRWNTAAAAGLLTSRPSSHHARCCIAYGTFSHDTHRPDSRLFRTKPAEAAALDPQQRMMLEAGYGALHQGGRRRSELRASDTGAFLGMMNCDAAAAAAASSGGVPGPYDATGVGYSSAAARLSFVFAMEGPTLAIDTACSSSSMAAHASCRSLERADCDAGATVGVNAMLVAGAAHVGPAATGMLSMTGRCHTWDARANGYARGE